MNRDQFDRPRGKPSPRLDATKRKIAGWNMFVDKLVGGLKPVETLIWAVLYRHATDGVVTRVNSQLAKDVNVSDKTVRRAITALRKAKLLKVIKQGGLHVGPSTYRLHVRNMRRTLREPAEVPLAEPGAAVALVEAQAVDPGEPVEGASELRVTEAA